MASIPFQHSYPMKPLSPSYTQLPPQPHASDPSNAPNSLLQKAKTAHQRVRTIQTLSRTISVILNTLIFAIMAFTISVFLSTRHDQINDRSVWPANSKYWPTIMLLVGSFVTLVLEVVVLCFYCICFTRAQNSWKLVLTTHVAHFGVWLVITFLYRYEKRLDDVWGWSCSDVAAVLQRDLNGSMNFERLCSLQEASWIFSILETVLKVLFAFVYFALYRKTRGVDAKLRLADTVGGEVSGLLQSAF